MSSACMSMQHQLDRHERELSDLREQISRLQATNHSEFEQMRSELQSFRGTLEENTVVHNREIKSLRERIDTLTAAAAPSINANGPAVSTPDADLTGIPVDSEQSLYDRALEMYHARDYEQARSSFQAFAVQYPTSQLAPNALFWIGMCLFQQKNYQACIAALDDLIKKFPQAGKVPDAYYWQAMSFLELKETLTAQILLETLMQSYPETDAAQRAKVKYEEISG